MPGISPPRFRLHPHQDHQPLWNETVCHPTKYSCRIILRDARPRLPFLDGRVAVLQDRRRNQYRRMWGKLNRDFEIPQDKVSPLRVIVLSEAGNCTPAPRKILVILVRERTSGRPKIETQRAERRVEEGASELGIPNLQSGQDVFAKGR